MLKERVSEQDRAKVDSEDVHVLIFHDDNERLDHLINICQREGYRTSNASAVPRALELTKRQGFDVVLIGLVGPEMAGYQVLKHVRTEPTLQHLPVLLIAESEAMDPAHEHLNVEADDYVAEPYSPALLRTRIQACLEKSRLWNELILARKELAQKAHLVHDLTNVILPLGAALSAEKDPNKLLEQILLEAKAVCKADAGTLYLRTEEDTLKFTIMRTDSLGVALGGTTKKEVTQPTLPMYDPGTGLPNEHNIASHVALHARSVNIADVYNAEGFDFSGTKVFDARNAYRSKSCLAVPLADHTGRVIGVLQLINAQDPQNGEVVPFDSYAQQVVESLASLAAVAISNQRLLEQQQKLLKFERDIQIGRQIQRDFLPQQLPELSGWEVAAYFRPAREVSGDFYDLFHFPDRRHVGLVIADISDKGVAAALFMALIRSLLRAFSEVPVSPGLLGLAERYRVSAGVSEDLRLTTLLTHLSAMNAVLLTNNYLTSNHGQANMFATLFWGVLDTATGMLTYVNCGHEPLMVLDATGLKGHLAPTGPAIGVFPDMPFEISQVHLAPGEVVFGYTDGVTDARDGTGKFFSGPRLKSLLKDLMLEQPDIPPDALLKVIEGSVLTHVGGADQYDDITMLGIRRLPQSKASSD